MCAVCAPSFGDHIIQQSCSWACCPSNEITVSLRHSAGNILSTCSPTLTLTGLQDAVVPNGRIDVTNLFTNTSHNGIWNSGTFVMSLSDLMHSGKAHSFHFRFIIKNPNFPISSPPLVGITARIRPRKHCNYDQAGQDFSGVMTSPAICASAWDFAGGNGVLLPSVQQGQVSSDGKSGTRTVTSTTTYLTDSRRLNSTCLGCCHKSVTSNITEGIHKSSAKLVHMHDFICIASSLLCF